MYMYIYIWHNAKHHWNFYAWLCAVYQEQSGHDSLHTRPLVVALKCSNVFSTTKIRRCFGGIILSNNIKD